MATPAPPLISEYANGGFTIADEFHGGSILITGEDGDGFTIQPWDVADPDEISRASLDAIYSADNRPMLVLIGCGEVMDHPFAKLRAELSKEGIAVEIQPTPAACRTWNLLLSEGRKVAFAGIASSAAALPK
ncbi:MAG: Mth938-like domain-containing protein [Alphaproteobacteria bacterium]|nr:Mth938-like domain-containing protein [Alphaproteobacteria bacterium]